MTVSKSEGVVSSLQLLLLGLLSVGLGHRFRVDSAVALHLVFVVAIHTRLESLPQGLRNHGAGTVSRVVLLLEFLLQRQLLPILVRILSGVVRHLKGRVVTGVQIYAEEVVIVVSVDGDLALLPQSVAVDLLHFGALVLRNLHVEPFCRGVVDRELLRRNELGFIGSCTRLLLGHATSLRNLELVAFDIAGFLIRK